MTTPSTSGGTILTSVTLEQQLEPFLPYAEADLASVLDDRTAYEWLSVDGAKPGSAFTFSPTVVSVEVVAPLASESASGTAIALRSGYSALLLEGNEGIGLTDGGLGHALLAGNDGRDSIAALGEGDTLVGATGAGTLFYAELAAGEQPSATAHDVTIRGGGSDTIATNDDAALVYTGAGGHSQVFLGASANAGGIGNDVLLNGSDTVSCAAGGDDGVTVGAAAGLGGDLVFGPPSGALRFVGGNAPFTVVGGSGGQMTVRGGAANGNLAWAGSGALDYVGGAGSASIVGGSGQVDVQGGAGPVTVFGGTGAGDYSGGNGSVFVVGDGASTVQAGAGCVAFLEGSANVSVDGSDGAVVDGTNSSGADALNAGAGSETLFGGHGSDTFTGGSGSAVLASGGGADTFIFADGQAGHDYLLNFDVGQDSIELNGFGASDPTISYAFGDSILNLQDGTQVVVIGVSHLTDASIHT